jgi:VWFA-related protein
MEERRMLETIERVQAASAHGQTLQEGRSQLDELINSVQVESETLRADGVATIRAVQSLVTGLSTVPGQKSLLYVGDGVSVRPGQAFHNLLADLFEGDRRFSQPGGSVSELGGSPGTGSSEQGQGESSGGFGAARNDSRVTPMSSSTNTLRMEGMSNDLTADLRALTATANSQRVTLYGISTGEQRIAPRADVNVGTRTSTTALQNYESSRSQLLDRSLQQMASETGGLALPAQARIDGFVDRMLTDEQNRYSLAYVSPHGGDSRFHRIKVKIDRKGVRLRHREGYIDRPRQARVGDVVAGALILGAGENPHHIEMELQSQEPAESDEVRVSFTLRIPIDEIHLVGAGDKHEATLDLYVLSRDGSGAFAPMRYVALNVVIPSDRLEEAAGQFYGATLPVILKKGPQTVAVGVVEAAVQRTSVVRMELEAGI